MKNFRGLFSVLIITVLFSCENEVELSGEFKETAVVYGLLDAGVDTQFVKVNKTFLEEGKNAIELAQERENLYFDDIKVSLKDLTSNEVFQLSTIEIPKEEGLFTNEKNIVYYLDTTLEEERDYQLRVVLPNGEIASATTQTLEPAAILNPDDIRQQLGFYRSSPPSRYLDVNFKFGFSENIAKLDAYLTFKYEEQVGNRRFDRAVTFPLGRITNARLINGDDRIVLEGRRFYEQIARLVPKNGNRKRVAAECITIEVFAADQNYAFYQDINGPIDNLAQVKPEFSNVNNGLGLFASRSTGSQDSRLTEDSRTELFSGAITGGSEYNFTDP